MPRYADEQLDVTDRPTGEGGDARRLSRAETNPSPTRNRYCVRFPDYAAERILLREAGGEYSFVHRLLQEHFASLKDRAGTAVSPRSPVRAE